MKTNQKSNKGLPIKLRKQKRECFSLWSVHFSLHFNLHFPTCSFPSTTAASLYPPATSKWNKIEHRLFSFISINWRAKPLTSLEVMLELLSHSTTKEGLTVTALKESHPSPTGIKVSDEELAALHLLPDSFHGECNYTLKPQLSPSQIPVI